LWLFGGVLLALHLPATKTGGLTESIGGPVMHRLGWPLADKQETTASAQVRLRAG